eukprot:4040364-Pyramimonas_sp.AAC.1
MRNEKTCFRAFLFTIEKAFFVYSEQRRAKTELYEAPGGYQVRFSAVLLSKHLEEPALDKNRKT